MARSRRSAEEAIRAKVFVHVRPVDAVTAAGDPPILPLRFGGVEQPRVPDERYAYRPSVHQSDGQRILRDLDVFHTLVSRRRRDAHARPPIARFGVPSPTIVGSANPSR